MSEIIDAARARRLKVDPFTVTGDGHPVLRNWKWLGGHVDPKLVGTDPTGQAWVIERVEASSGTVWMVWTVEDFNGDHYEANPVHQSRRSDAVDYVSNRAALTPPVAVIE
jgi:hypothetical protein